MDNWKTLERHIQPRLSIYSNGQINWSRAVQEHLGDPDRVVMRLDRDAGKLAIMAVEEGGYKVSKASSFTVSARGVLRREGLLPERTYRVRPELVTAQDGSLVIVDVAALLEAEKA